MHSHRVIPLVAQVGGESREICKFTGITDYACGGLSRESAEDSRQGAVGAEGACAAVGEKDSILRQSVELRGDVCLTPDSPAEFTSEALPYYCQYVGTVVVQQFCLRRAVGREEWG